MVTPSFQSQKPKAQNRLIRHINPINRSAQLYPQNTSRICLLLTTSDLFKLKKKSAFGPLEEWVSSDLGQKMYEVNLRK